MSRWVIRIVMDDSECARYGDLIECLRYAGQIKVHRIKVHRIGCFDVMPPNGTNDSKQWADMNAERFSSFGFNAVAAPEWKDC